MNPQKNSSRETAVPGIKPGYFSRIPNRLIADLLRSLKKPWPDEAVRLYLHSLVGFGNRRFIAEGLRGHRYVIQLDVGEFVCSVRKLAEISGRSRPVLKRLIGEFAVVTRLSHQSGFPVYRLKEEIEPPFKRIHDRVNQPSIAKNMVVINSPKLPPTSRNLYHYRENIIREKKERERKNVDNSSLHSDPAAHDPKERKTGEAIPLSEILPAKKASVPQKPSVSKERALRRLAEIRHKIPWDQLIALMQRYGITSSELDAACDQMQIEGVG
jgi:hypothetical protein